MVDKSKIPFTRLDNSNNIVTINTAQTITGLKAFMNSVLINHGGIEVIAKGDNQNVTPSANVWKGIFVNKSEIFDSSKHDGVNSWISGERNTNGVIYTNIYARKIMGDNTERISYVHVTVHPNGTGIVYCPTSPYGSTGTEIVTAQWAKAMTEGYPNFQAPVEFVLDAQHPFTAPANGWIMNNDEGGAGTYKIYISGRVVGCRAQWKDSWMSTANTQCPIKQGEVVSFAGNNTSISMSFYPNR